MSKKADDKAYQEWTAYVDKHFSADDECTVDGMYPTLGEINELNKLVIDRLPQKAVSRASAGQLDVIERDSAQMVSIGESFRSKKAKIYEFHYKRMGKAVPSQQEGFFEKVMSSIGVASLEEPSLSRLGSEATSQAGSGHGSGASYSLRRRAASDASPMLDSLSQTSTTSSNALAGVAPATGPRISQNTSRDLKFREAYTKARHLLDDYKEGKLEFINFKRSAGRVVNFVRKLGMARFKDTKAFGWDTVRAEFSSTASEQQVKTALRKAMMLMERANPQQAISVPTIRPIIMVPGFVNSVINIHNAKQFLGLGRWMDPMQAKMMRSDASDDVVMKVDRPNCPFKEFLVRDGVEHMQPHDWDYVCAIFVTGQTWQFSGFFPQKDKPGGKRTRELEPRDVLTRVAGFNLQYEDEALHPNVTKWNLLVLRVSKNMNRRHKDIKTVEDFWRALLKKMPHMKAFRHHFREGA